MRQDTGKSLMKIDLDRLYKEYFTSEFKKLPFFKMEKMFNDFKIVLLMIDNFKSNYYNRNSKGKDIFEGLGLSSDNGGR